MTLVAGTGAPSFSGDNDLAIYAALNTPTGVAVDAAGNVYIADSGNGRVRKVNASDKKINTVAGNGGYGYVGEGIAATSASFAIPYGVTVDTAGNLYIADFYNSKVRKVDTSGIITTFVGNGMQDYNPWHVATNVFVGFAGDGDQAAPDGYSILNGPYSVAADPFGNIYIADVNNWRVRMVATNLLPSLSSVHIASSNTNPERAKTNDTVTLTITSSQPISAPTVTIAGRRATVAGSGTSWSAYLVMNGTDPQGMVSFSITYKGLSGVSGPEVHLVTDSSSVTFDSVAPAVTISSAVSNPTKTSPIPVTVTFSEAVTGFTSGDVVVTNGAVGAFSGTGTTYTFNVAPSAQGAVTVDVAAGVAFDAAANGNSAAAQFSRTYDNTVPTVTISSIASNPTKTSPIPVTVTFSEAVTGFTSGDVVVTNGAVGAFSGSGTTYTFNVAPSAQGAVTVDVAAGVAQDAAANGNSAAAQFSRTYDNTAPTVTISSIASNPTKTSPIPVTVTFSEAVTGFTSGDVIISNGTVGAFSGSGTTYTFDVTPSGQGTVTVDVAANTAQDAAGNGNSAAPPLARTYDTGAPTVTIDSIASNPTKTSPIPVTVTFSEAVTGFTSGDVVVTNGTVGTFNGSGTTYTFNVTPGGNGAVTVDVAAGVAFDAAANGNTAAAQFSRTYDNTAPTVTISSIASNPTNTSPIPVTVTFSEAVTGFTSGDVVVTNGIVGAFSGSGTTYTFNVAPSAQGAVTVDVAAGVAFDPAANGNSAASQLIRTYDTIGATVTIASTAPNVTNTFPIPVTVTFSEAVTGFASGDVVVTNGAVGAFSGSGTTYTFNITPAANGIVAVDVAAGVAQDAAANGNSAAAQFSRTYDNTVPTVTISSIASNPTKTSPIPVTVTFSEAVTGFTSGDVVVTNGTVGAFSGTGTTYTFNVAPGGNGAVTVDVAAGVAQDAAANGNSAAAQFSRTYDNTAPTVTISSIASNPTKTSPIPVTVTFSEAVTGFTSGDVVVTNGTVGAFSGTGTTYTFNVAPGGNGAVTVDVAAGVAQDAAANGNSAAAQFSRTYDTIAPTATISSTAPPLTNTSPIPVTVIFSEAVTGFASGDVVVNNGTVGAFSGTGTTYTFRCHARRQWCGDG